MCRLVARPIWVIRRWEVDGYEWKGWGARPAEYTQTEHPYRALSRAAEKFIVHGRIERKQANASIFSLDSLVGTLAGRHSTRTVHPQASPTTRVRRVARRSTGRNHLDVLRSSAALCSRFPAALGASEERRDCRVHCPVEITSARTKRNRTSAIPARRGREGTSGRIPFN